MADVNSLKYPRKSHRKNVILPKHSGRLAEFFGIMMGDGGINNLWQATITLNALSDSQYSRYVSDLCKVTFGITPAMRRRKSGNALVISLASTSIIDFLVAQGLVRGNKLKGGLRIPKWILGKSLFRKSCVRGLIDTDGCFFVHTHRVRGRIYKNIGLCFTSYSPELIFQVRDIFEENGIIGHITNGGRRIYLYSANEVTKYLKVFSTSNERILSVYKKWRDARVV